MTTERTEPKDDFFNEENEVKTTFIKWGAIGDYIKGTLLSVREVYSTLPGHEHEKVKLYELKAEKGSFHDMNDDKKSVEPAILFKEGNIVTVGGRATIDAQMRNIKIGQIVGIKYTSTVPAKKKGFSAVKILKVYRGLMNPDYELANLENDADLQLPPV